jgi:pyruvate formate lyase activating enzyme
MIGEAHTAQELMQKLRPDIPYFASSGGGVTFTGGEPMLHPRFLDHTLDLCMAESIQTNIETAGLFSLEEWKPILPKLDLIYFDLKLMDPEQHSKHLGGGYETIRRNAIALVRMGLPVEFRMALIPGLTDTDANIDAVVRFLRRIERRGIHLLAYHNMGEAKIDIIRGGQPRLGLARLTQERLVQVRRHFLEQGIAVLNEGPAAS